MAKSKKSAGGERTFKTIKLMLPTWHAGEDNDAPAVIGTIEKATVINLPSGARRVVHLRLSEPTIDGDGVEFAAGDLVLIWQSAELNGLEAYEGEELRITPDGYGKKTPGKNPPRKFTVELVE